MAGSRRCNGAAAAARLIVIVLLYYSWVGPTIAEGNVSSCIDSERRALLSLTAANPGAAVWLSSWTGEDCCNWSRVSCDDKTGHVTQLSLGCQYPEIGLLCLHSFPLPLLALTHLEYLDLSSNKFTGEILPLIGNFTKLRELYLSGNSIQGAIPETICNLTGLQMLQLSGNNISGPIPDTIGNLHQLQILNLSNNNIDRGIPTSMASLCSLTVLDLSHNPIGGAIDHLIQGLSRCVDTNKPSSLNITGPGVLQVLRVGYNRLTGTIPQSLGQLHRLFELDMASNFLTGTLTELHFANLTNLIILDLSYNQLGLNVSPSWVPPFQAEQLLLCSCQLGPKFPAWIQSQLATFSMLCISEAGISDEIPDWLWQANFYSAYFNVSRNNITGRLSEPVSSMTMTRREFNAFDVSHNRFEGPVPELHSFLLQAVDLSNNLFTGGIPSSLAASWEVLQSLSLSHNRINGSVPSFVCEMTSLKVLDLSNNDMSGEIPPCWNQSSQLVIVDLSNNSFSGQIPSSIGSLTQLGSLHLRNNRLSGKIPQSLQHCKSLILLDIGENFLSGKIPLWIGESLSSLKFLRLTSNLLDGSIPIQLSQLCSLQVLDLASNFLSGSLPSSFGNLSSMVEIQDESKLMNKEKWEYYGAQSGGLAQPSYRYHPYLSCYLENLLLTAKGVQLEYTKVLSLVISMDLSSNRLVGSIPEELTHLHVLRFLNLSHNLFTGRIPGSIGAMGQLESLDLSNNQLSGNIPSNMSDLNFLNRLNLSNNNLSGRIPPGTQLQSFDLSIYQGNRDLCGLPLGQCDGDAPSKSPPHVGDQEDEDAGSETIWIYAGSALGFVVGFWGLVGTVMIKRSVRFAYFRFIDKICDRVYFYFSNGREE